MSVTIDGTNGIDSPDLNITGTGAKVSGDFSNATIASRVLFQTSIANSPTFIEAIPSGSSVSAGLNLSNSSTDPANSSLGQVRIDGATFGIASTLRGSGGYLPMTFYTGGSERFRIDTAGQIGIGGANFGTAGQVLTSQGPSAAPVWASPSTGTAPKFSALRSTSQSVGDVTSTIVSFDFEEYDTNNNYNPTTSRFTPTVAGYYFVTMRLTMNSGAAGSATISLLKNGSVEKYIAYGEWTSTKSVTVQGSALVYCNGTTDYLELSAYGTPAFTISGAYQERYFQGFLVA